MSFFCLGISGQKRSGKDTLAKILIPLLQKELNTVFYHESFADAVKNILCMFYYKDLKSSKKVSRDFIEEYKNKEDFIPGGWNMCVRDALVNIGDRFREIYSNIWIDIIFNKNNNNKIITDVRYENEIYMIKNNSKGLIIRVIRDSEFKESGDNSEISLLKFDKKILDNYEGPGYKINSIYDYIIRNNGTIEEYENNIVMNLLPFILNKWKFFI
jgi:hypothetical protein